MFKEQITGQDLPSLRPNYSYMTMPGFKSRCPRPKDSNLLLHSSTYDDTRVELCAEARSWLAA